MIDWYSLGFSALWIIGLGLIIAAMSFGNYWASQQKQRFKTALGKPAFRIIIGLGLIFFCLGWAGGVSTVWERILWAVLAFIFALLTWQAKKMGNP